MGIDRDLLAAVGVVISVLLTLFMRSRPKVALVLWLLVVSFVPIWVGVNAALYFPAVVVMSGLGVVALIGLRSIRVGLVDIIALLIPVIYCLALLLGHARIADGVTLFTYWGLGYAFGRLVGMQVPLRWVYASVSIIFLFVAVIAVIEYFFRMNVFVQIPATSSSLHSLWSELQPRGGVVRAEGAFGHSIALGAVIALTVPMVVAARLPVWIRAVIIACLLGAVALTLSRIGMISAVLALVLTVLFIPSALSRRTRITFMCVLAAMAVVAVPLLSDAFGNADEEASGSASYRTNLLALIPQMRSVGIADAFQVGPDGRPYFGDFQSIDSALILLGLTYGAIPLGAVVVLLGGACLLVLKRRATAPTIAVVAQIPALTSVALITQYTVFFWFVCGLAVSSQIVAKGRSSTSQKTLEEVNETGGAAGFFRKRPVG